jgi:hypothetical protein
MPLDQQQTADLWALIQNGITRAGLLRTFVPTILGGIDKRIPTIPSSLREAKVGDVLDTYAFWRASGKL